MKLMYYRGEFPNFGDELNTWMFPKLCPQVFDDDGNVLFIGIGSTIGNHYDDAATKIIFGTGFVPQYNSEPDMTRGKWQIYFVRGPHTARMLNLAPELSLGDSAILMRTLVDFKKNTAEMVSFIPHWESLGRGNWEEVCRLAGINLIDPRRPVDEVIQEFLRSKLIIAEAMHGAIVADAFRIPWIPVLPLDAVHRHKWVDWADALGVTIDAGRLWPSSVVEAQHALRCRPALVNVLTMADMWPFSKLASKSVTHIAANRLVKLSKAEPNLSEDRIISDVTERMLEMVQRFRQDYNAPHSM